MSALTISHSVTSLSTDGDFDTGRGQLGYTAIGTLTGAVNDLWSLCSPYKPHFCVLDCAANCALQLPAVGSSSLEANIGHRISIHNKSGVGNIDIQNSSSVSVYVLAPGVVTTLIATSAPGGWDFTTMVAPSGATLQSAYNAGNTIFELANREVLIQDNAGFNNEIFAVKKDAGTALFRIGNSLLGVDTPYIESVINPISNPQASTIYTSTVGIPYSSVNDDAGRIVEVTDNKREVLGLPNVALGIAGSSVVRDSTGARLAVDSANYTSYNYVGLPNTTYQFKVNILIKNSSAFCSSQLIFGMNNAVVTNTLSSLYQENQISAPITTDPDFTIASFGTSGVTIGIRGPDYAPPGLKNYDAAIELTVIGFTA